MQFRDLSWHTPPRFRGQVIQESYACDAEGLYRRVEDLSVPRHQPDRVTTYFAPWDDWDRQVWRPWEVAPGLRDGAHWRRDQ